MGTLFFGNPSRAVVSSFMTPLTLLSAQIDLTMASLPRHVTLNTTHWMLTSTELQDLVPCVIHKRIEEQFIDHLSRFIINTRMPPEDSVNLELSEAYLRSKLLCALSTFGADGDSLSQLNRMLSNLDSHGQNLFRATTHRIKLSASRGSIARALLLSASFTCSRSPLCKKYGR
jgi:hypothetical protein